MIAEALITAMVDGLVAMFGLLDSFGLAPTWPTWVTGGGSEPNTIRGLFSWLSDGLEPMAAWVNVGLLGSVLSTLFLLQAGIITWNLIYRAVIAAKSLKPW